MSDRRNGLYYESKDIRNHVLSRNIGEYRGYKWSFLANGGLAVGMPYAVETELVPYSLSERAQEGLHLDTLVTKDSNPMIKIGFREGGLFGYTHEVYNGDFDWISRNRNLLRSYFDYDSTEDLKNHLTRFPDSLPWNESLRWYSSDREQQNTEHFFIYPEYISSMKIGKGLSFDKHLGEEYLGRLFNMGFDYENLAENVGKFVGDYSKSITDDIYDLEKEPDTKLGYIGRRMLNEAKWKQIDANHWELGYQKYADIQDRDLSSVESDIYFEGKRRSTYDGDENNFSDKISTRTYSEYDERDTENGDVRDRFDGTRYGDDNASGIEVTGQRDLLSKTAELFRQHKIKTLVGRFHTSVDDPGSHEVSLIQSAVDLTKGMSHGRNLFKLIPDSPNDYDNPYCRVWTYHHQYSRMVDLIRPFTDENGSFKKLEDLQSEYPGRPIVHDPGRGSWTEKSVLNKNGMVNIAPTRRIGADRVQIKQCMFSIENLAWKNVHKHDTSILDDIEIGPLGGRIMWFPPYNLQFNESVNVSWGSNDFIGRGEKVYSYANTERTGTLSFTIIEDHPSIVDYWINSDNRYSYGGTEEDEQKLLRFFAGCENLEAGSKILGFNDRPWDKNGEPNDARNNPKNQQDKTVDNPDDNINEDPAPTPPEEFTKENSISFYLFYPNNLSCIDFINNPKVGVNYIVNGRDGFEFNPKLTGSEDISYDAGGTGSALLDTTKVTVGAWADDIYMLTNGPGYEMGRSGGVGLTRGTTAEEVSEYNKKNDNVDSKKRRYHWGYGIDQKYVGQRLCGPNGFKKFTLPNGEEKQLGFKTFKLYPKNYSDLADFSLNNRPNSQDEACNFSFMDVAEAITPKADAGGYNYKGKSDSPEKVQEIRKILGLDNEQTRGSGGRKYYFAVAGGASVHGYDELNDELSKNRAAFLESWLKYCFSANNLTVVQDENVYVPFVTSISGGEDDLIVNSESAKRGRFAKAVIFWDDENVNDTTDPEQYSKNLNNDETVTYKENVIGDDELNEEELAESAANSENGLLERSLNTRYRDEELFFSLLEERSPVVYKNIVDKVKYFDPAFHSITPEGFNSRLSFLQQCSRQGPTMASSDLKEGNGISGAGYAGNLSFGRAPVCVLRLGDFYNTRIIINSVQIQYETSQWDLNPEGIGVQPMLANVTLSFTFQGGSSLGGPIQRLQNAVSFNYYANQEVYDDRADVAVYKNGELDEEKSLIWIPGYGSMNIGSVASRTGGNTPKLDVTNDEIVNNDVASKHAQQSIERNNAILKTQDSSD